MIATTKGTIHFSRFDRMSSVNGIFFRIERNGEPLLLIHGVMATGKMFDPLVELLRERFRMLIPDLRGHGRSSERGGPFDVEALASDLDVVLNEAHVYRTAVMSCSGTRRRYESSYRRA